MKIPAAFVIVVVLATSGVADAAMREYTIIFGGGVSSGQLAPVGPTMIFAYPDGAFSDDIVDTGELSTTFAINHTDFPGVDFTLTEIDLVPNVEYNLHFVAPDNSLLKMELNAVLFQQPSGTELPDGTEERAFTQYFDGSGVPNSEFDVNLPTVNIGTVAIPEPSAFGFAAVALAFVGTGRYLRRRFWG